MSSSASGADSPPRPEQTGSERGEIEQPSSTAIIRAPAGISSVSHFGAVIEEISEIRSGVAMQLAAAGVRQLAAENQNLRDELSDARAACESWREKFYEEKTARAVLDSQLRDRPRIHRLQNVALAVGGIIGGVGVPMLIDPKSLLVGSVLTAAGGVLVTLGAARIREKE